MLEFISNLNMSNPSIELFTAVFVRVHDKRSEVRYYACEVLGQMGGKAATNEAITELVSALADESDEVRSSACEALGKMGEEAATNEVVVALANVANSCGFESKRALENILTTVAAFKQINPNVVA